MSNILETLKEKFDQAEQALNGSVPEVLHQARQNAMQQVLENGLPGKKSEAYKYTNVSKTLSKFGGSGLLETSEVKELPSAAVKGFNELVFINGTYSPEHSTLLSPSSELKVLTLNEAPEKEKTLFDSYYGKIAGKENDAFVALNTAFSTGGVVIHIAKKARPIPVLIRHITDTTQGEGISYSRNLVVAEPFSESILLEQFEGSTDNEYFLNSLSEVHVDVNAHIRWHKLQNNPQASQIDQMAVYQGNASRFDLTTLTTEGNVIRNNVRISVDGEGCETHLYGLYLANGTSHVDNQTSVDHIQPHSESNELYKGILDDKSRGVFNGKVYVRKEAQKTNAFQSNKNILLSDNATVNTKPQLEIWADDVKCSHGCTTGQIDQEALFYLRSRGLSEEMARRLMLRAFAIDTMHGIEHKEIKDLFEEEITRKLDT